jgi:uncharacterized membrane protein
MVLKERLVLAFNFFKPIAKWAYKLYISWSSLGIGAVLMQMANEGKKFIIARVCRSNNNAEAQYNSYVREYLAVIWAISHF